jgi:hypothetical protein
LGGYQSSAELNVRDRSGNVETLLIGDTKTNFYQKITIECESEVASEIYISYVKKSGSNVTFSAITAKH